MASLIELRRQREHANNKYSDIMTSAVTAHRELTKSEDLETDALATAVIAYDKQIQQLESRNTMGKAFPGGMVLADAGGPGAPRKFSTSKEVKTLTAEYAEAFYDFVATRGTKLSAALYEGSDGAGGYSVPVLTDSQIVPLAPSEMAVRQLATVIATTNDIKLPQQASFGTAAAKAELSAFGESEPTLSQVTLSAFMAGIVHNVSWELAQDVPAFQSFAVQDLVIAQQLYEENKYVNGSGSGEPQGLVGNVGAGVVAEPDTNGNLVSISGTLDLTAKLNAIYHPGASWLMSRATSIIIRKAQVGANLFEPVWTRENNIDYLHGYPVAFSSFMPAAARGATPVIFGNFKAGFVIGDRGGSGINVKVLDQPLATQGILQLLAYRRTDSRVRRSEALQEYTVAAS